MKIRTAEDNFEYQAEAIFESMLDDYQEEQADRKERGESTETFAEWLWNHCNELGAKFYEAFHNYADIDESTEKYNI